MAPCVVLEWKSRFSCFLWTSLSSGIVLPRRCSAECLYIVTLLASLVPTYFQFDSLFSIRAVIDLHLSLNLHEDEDRERSCASVRISVCLWFPGGPLALTPHANETAGVAECGIANISTDSFSQCHLLMTLYIHCLITGSAYFTFIHTHTHKRLVLLSDADLHIHTTTPTCSVLICRLFTSNNVIFFSPSAASTPDKCH